MAYDGVESSATLEEGSKRNQDLALAVHMNLDTALKLSRLQPQAMARGVGVSASQFMMLSDIHRQPGIQVNEVARSRSVTPSTASNLLDKMERRRWLRRKRSDRDQRVVRLFITCEGRKVLGQFPSRAHGLGTSALSMIPVSALAELNRHLEVLISHLKAMQADALRPRPMTRERSARKKRNRE